ncbi:MAG: hypothetical protein ACTSWY_15260 [Promethearchaeota archaeon]
MSDIYILNVAGNVLFYYTDDETKKNEAGSPQDPNMVASFLTGILQFAKAVHNDEISNFEMGKSTIVITSSPLVHYIIISEKKEMKKISDLESKLARIRNLFENRYKDEEIKNWTGDLDYFLDFKNEITGRDIRFLEKNEKKQKFIEVWQNRFKS